MESSLALKPADMVIYDGIKKMATNWGCLHPPNLLGDIAFNDPVMAARSAPRGPHMIIVDHVARHFHHQSTINPSNIAHLTTSPIFARLAAVIVKEGLRFLP